MKGFIEEIGWTILVLLTVVVVIFMALFALISIEFPFGFLGESPTAASIEFVTANVRPYVFANSLSHFLAGDRNFLEHANEIAAAGLENASSQRLATYLSAFFAPYLNDDSRNKINLVVVTVTKNDTELFRYDNREKKCGDNFEGFCVDPNIARVSGDPTIGTYTTNVGCGVGRKQIDASSYTKAESQCRNEICCVEDETNGQYSANVIRCGVPENNVKQGVCDVGRYGKCVAGRMEINEENRECSSLSLVCCAPLTEEFLVQAQLASTAAVPLLYKGGSLGLVEVTVG